MAKIPVIDIAKVGLLVPNDADVKTEDYESVGGELYKALSQVGFAYLKNAGISDEQIAKVQTKFQDFFRLHLETKKKFYSTDEPTCGYFAVGTENLQHDVKDYKEAFNVNSRLFDDPKRSPNSIVENFDRDTKEFSNTCKKLALRMFLTISYGMKLKDVRFLENRHVKINEHGNLTTLRGSVYPPVTDDAKKSFDTRLGSHTDYGTFTLLFQDDVGGLQVEGKPGVYEEEMPIPGTIVMNIGDTMNLWTEGRLKSTVHRVVIPSDKEARLRQRTSLAYYIHADDEVPIETMEYLPDADPPHPEQRLFDPECGPKTALEWALHKHYEAHNIPGRY